MDFHHDLAEISSRGLKNLGIQISPNWDNWHLYMNWVQIRQRRLDSLQHYQVIYSQELTQKLADLSENDKKNIADIENRLRNAEPITDYMSKLINSPSIEKSDFLLKAWNIYHLHLEKKNPKKKYTNPLLLFFQRKGNVVYFIDVRQHPYGNKWFSHELLEIVHDNWPELVRYIPNMKPVLESGASVNLTDEQVFELMKNGVTTIVPFRDGSLLYTSGGIAASGDGGTAVFIADKVWNSLSLCQIRLNTNPQRYCNRTNNGAYRIPNYKLVLEDGSFFAYDKRRKEKLFLFKEPEI